MTNRYDVVITGAGLAGSSMACVLARKGWSVLLLERLATERHKVCGEFLSPEGYGMLTALGLDEVVGTLGVSIMDTARITTADGCTLELPLPGTAIGVSRLSLDHALLQHARELGAQVCSGITVERIERRGEAFFIRAVHRRTIETFEAKAAIGAWGRNGMPGRRNVTDHVAAELNSFIGIKCHLIEARPASKVELFFFQGGYLGLSPIEKGITNAAALLSRSFFKESGQSIQGAIKLAQTRNPALQQRLQDSIQLLETQAAVSPVFTNHRISPWGQVPHIGDAAVVIPPLCGDGMSMALRSVERCAPLADQYLQGSITWEEWQECYSSVLRNEFARPVRWGRLLQAALGNPVAGPLLIRSGRLWPGLASRVIQATRISP